jgi:hypothetical protein
MPQGRVALQQIAQKTSFPLLAASLIAGRLRRASNGELWPRAERGIPAAQVQPDHLIGLTLGIGLAASNPKDAPELVRSVWNLRRRTLTLTPEGAVTTAQIDALESEAAAIFLPIFGTTLVGLVDQLAGAMPDQLRANIAVTLNVELRLDEARAVVTFVEPGIGTFRCLFSALEPSEISEVPDTALVRIVTIPGALLLELGSIWADSQARISARTQKAVARPPSTSGLRPAAESPAPASLAQSDPVGHRPERANNASRRSRPAELAPA